MKSTTPVRRGFRCLCTCGEYLNICVEDMLVVCREGCGFEADAERLREMAEGFLALSQWIDTAPENPEE